MAEEVIVEISPQGKVTLEAKGFKGGTCEQVLSKIEEELGTVTNKTLKPEYHERVPAYAKVGK
jgi:hypothetical protein